MDRPTRPLFPEGFRDEVLIQAMVLSTDGELDPDVLAMVGTSAALTISDIPFEGPTGAVRVARVEGKYIVNPTVTQMEMMDAELVVAGHAGGVNMIEMGGMEIDEEAVLEGIDVAYEHVKSICEAIEELRSKCGKEKDWTPPPSTDDLKNRLRKRAGAALREARQIKGKLERGAAIDAIYDEVVAELCPEDATVLEFDVRTVRTVLDEIEGEIVASLMLESGVRSDGRGAKDIRPISCEVGVLPRVHGSSLFTRGETQSLATITLGTGRDEQFVDGIMGDYSKKFMLHYNFPPFCVGEARRVGPVSRREMGHGNLAEKSLEGVLPSPEDFPYTVRLVSEIMESNGSSSMASVCAGTLALMDAGVPIVRPVAGISIGAFHDGDRRQLVVDILGEEDHFGDMDFKVAGTQRGITGIQVDLKDRQIPQELIMETLQLAKDARIQILRSMLEALQRPRADISAYAPRLLTIKINPEKIGKVIGPGGRGIKALEAETGANIDISDDGTIMISCSEMKGAEQARALIEAMTDEVKVGAIYTGKVVSIKDFGAFIEIAPGQDGLCHISELATGFVRDVNEVCKLGDMMKVKVIQVDNQGRLKLSRKAVVTEEEASEVGA